MIGLSGGINSMALLCWLSEFPAEKKPIELHLFYAHLVEHSPETLQFVLDGWTFAQSKFENVIFKQTNNSALEYFLKKGLIPHPKLSPCSDDLKIRPMLKYCYENQIDLDLVGYVSGEMRRFKKANKSQLDIFFQKKYPILEFNDEWCFEIVDKYIGWHPPIYDIKDSKGNRLFKHNNCLPCKNMTPKQFKNVVDFYPEYAQRAKETEQATGSYFGRNKGDFSTDCRACSM